MSTTREERREELAEPNLALLPVACRPPPSPSPAPTPSPPFLYSSAQTPPPQPTRQAATQPPPPVRGPKRSPAHQSTPDSFSPPRRSGHVGAHCSSGGRWSGQDGSHDSALPESLYRFVLPFELGVHIYSASVLTTSAPPLPPTCVT